MFGENTDQLDPKDVESIAPLIGIGCQSGDTAMGLSAVRRGATFAFVFVATELAVGTLRELERRHSGSRLFRVADMPSLTEAAGRVDVSVLGVKPGSLAEGIAAKLSVSGPPQETPGGKG